MSKSSEKSVEIRKKCNYRNKSRNKGGHQKILWTKRELNEFAIGLQKYGFSQKEKIAELLSTRDKQEVILYLESAERTLQRKHLQRRRAKSKVSPYIECKNILMDSKLAVEVLEGPPIRKWNYMARNQQTGNSIGYRIDYSRTAIGDILQDFYDEAETPGNAQVIDVKSIYKFLIDCTKGRNPTELMPKESGLVLMLLKKLKEFQDSMDLDEERKYFRDYKGAVKFAPFKVKGEGKEKSAEEGGKNEDSQEKSAEEIGKNEDSQEKNAEEGGKNKDSQEKSEDDEEMDEDVYNPDAVKIPEELYNTFKTHYKLVEGFNPLLVPLWHLNKQQVALEPLMKDFLGRGDT